MTAQNDNRPNAGLQLFDDAHACPKCGAIDAGTRYDPDEDVINRTCSRCKYTWKELPLDHQDQP